MPLLSLWSSSPESVGQFTIEQVVSVAGDGVLKDNSVCSEELRQYLSQARSETLASYIEHCLSKGFPKSGMVLQDLVNELGRRLDYKATNGRYQGVVNAVGFDGIWVSPEGQAIIVEVKTTDAYRISLDTIATYRQRLTQVGQPSSILIVCGRDDTGELEAQIRGSRHAWDIRLISADALIKLVQLKESSEGPATGQKIRSLLIPMEFTRLDGLIDVMFTTAKDVETQIESEAAKLENEALEPDAEASPEVPKGTWQFTAAPVLDAKRDSILRALGKREGSSLIRKSRALFWDTRAV